MRRMLVVVLLIAGYFGVWEATKREAKRRKENAVESLLAAHPHIPLETTNPEIKILAGLSEYSSPAPFVIDAWYHTGVRARNFWFFGLFED